MPLKDCLRLKDLHICEGQDRNMDKNDILNTRLSRHCLVTQLSDENVYLDLFRRLQPVSTIYNTIPGAPPSLGPRTTFDDKKLTDRLRGSRTLIKGRFLGGGIGYVLAEDLHIYANAFRKPLTGFNERQRLVLDALDSCGPLAPRLIKEETGLLNKEIMPALHRMQTGFLVFEDQSDSDWERPWSLFEEEWPEVILAEDQRITASIEVLTRFLRANVFATFEQIKDWSRFSVSLLKTLMTQMQDDGLVSCLVVEGLGEGYILAEDQSLPAVDERPSAFMLHKSDPLVKAHASELKRLFGRRETLQYLLLDGELKGAVLGHWRIGPHDVDDISVLLPSRECKRRREEILSAVSQVYSPPRSRILKYCSERIRA